MAKGKSTWKYNKLLTARRNYFVNGSTINRALAPKIPYQAPSIVNLPLLSAPNPGTVTAPLPPQKKSLLGLDWSNPFKGGGGDNAVGAIGSAVGLIGGSLISGGKESGVGNVIGGLSNIASAIPGPWGAVASAGLGLIGGGVNALFGSKLNQENINKVEEGIALANNFNANVGSFDELANLASSTALLTNFTDDYIGSDGLFSHKAKDMADDLRSKQNLANARMQSSISNNAYNIANEQMDNLLSNYAAFGGELNTLGADFTNGLLSIDTGGTHETNPNEGVPMGIDPEGVPNLVEEGETIFNDYVYSRRLKVPKSFRKKYKLGGDLNFAEASKKLAKESEERPNDPISMNGLRAIMADLALTLEEVKQKQGKTNNQVNGNRYDWGSALRYMPVVGSGLAAMHGLAAEADYSNADLIANAARNATVERPVSYKPIGDYLSYTPMDTNYAINTLNAESAATRRAALLAAGLNRGAGISALLAADYKALNQLGALYRNALEYNQGLRKDVAEFNRKTNEANAEMALKASTANAELDAKKRAAYLEGMAKVAAMRDQIETARANTISGNLSDLFTSLGSIGKEKLFRKWIKDNPTLRVGYDNNGGITYLGPV